MTAPATTHRGPYHGLGSKAELALHLGVSHEQPDGSVRTVVSPSPAVRSRWRRDELEWEHRRLHGDET